MTSKLSLFASLAVVAGATFAFQSNASAEARCDVERPVIREQPFREIPKTLKPVRPVLPNGQPCPAPYPVGARFN